MWIAGNCMWKRKKGGAPVSQGPSSASPSRTLMILAFSPHPEQQGVGDVEPLQRELGKTASNLFRVQITSNLHCL